MHYSWQKVSVCVVCSVSFVTKQEKNKQRKCILGIVAESVWTGLVNKGTKCDVCSDDEQQISVHIPLAMFSRSFALTEWRAQQRMGNKPV